MKEMEKLLSYLMHSRTQTHVFHLQTKSYAEHIALGAYYDGIVGLIDGLAESFQGKNGIIENYDNFKLESYQDKDQLVKYFESLGKMVEFKDTYIQNQVDTVSELIYSTKYKLENLG
jgi:hypothetical protein